MYAVVNTMSLAKDLDPEIVARMQTELMDSARRVPGFVSASFIRTGEDTSVMLVICETQDAVQAVHDQVGRPWIGANLLPYLSGTDRRLGPVLASTHLS